MLVAMSIRVATRRPRRQFVLAVVVGTCLAGATGATWTAPAGNADAAATTQRQHHQRHHHHRFRMTAAAAAQAGVVDVTAQLGYNGEAAGTGIVLDRSGEILTNNHVIEGSTDIQVTVPGAGTYPAQVVGTDVQRDVALLDINGAPTGLSPAAIGDSSKVAVGDQVEAIGNAGGRGGAPSVVGGQVTGLHVSVVTTDETGSGSEYLHDLIRTDAPVMPGDSGGPLVDGSGKVVGMDTAATVRRPGSRRVPEAYAIPINRALHIIKTFPAAGGPTMPTAPAPVPVPVPAPLPAPVPLPAAVPGG
jgi:S1-C subfamily serine protease